MSVVDPPRAAVPEQAGIVEDLVAATEQITVEEFRLADFRSEQDARLGRRLLYLLSNTEWIRRTTENVEISRVRVVDTQVVVDVDLSYLASAVREDGGPLWLPILAVPPPAVTDDDEQRDPLTSMEVSDAAGARVTKATQSQVHRELAAALAELILARLPRTRPDGLTPAGRDEHALLAAALRRLLPGPAEGLAMPPDETLPATIETGRSRAEERLTDARAGLLAAVQSDLGRPRPVLRSRLVEMLQALVGVVYAVVPADDLDGPTSFAVQLPGRRLHQERRHRWSLAATAHLRVDLLAASAHSDRVVHLALPEGIAAARRPGGGPSGAGARIELNRVRPIEELRALTTLTLGTRPSGGRATGWTRRRLASLAVDKVEASLEVLAHVRPRAADDGRDTSTHVVTALRTLRDRLLAVVDSGSADPDAARTAIAELDRSWSGGAWLPGRFERRIAVNTATPGLVHVRATALEGSAQRATTGPAAVDVDVQVADSTALDTARDINLINLTLLGLVTVTLLGVQSLSAGMFSWHDMFLTRVARDGNNLDPQILATVLTLFPAIQASRVDRPDRSTLRGLLAQRSYLLSLATAFPPLLLATALTFKATPPGLAAIAALVLQAALHLLLRRPERGRLSGEPPLLLTTQHPATLASLDVLRGTWCRTLLADALLLGRRSQGYLVTAPDRPGALDTALEAALAPHAGSTRAASVQGLLHLTAAGRALTLVVAGGPSQDEGRAKAGRQGSHTWVELAPVEPGRLAAVEPPAWIVETYVALPRAVFRSLATVDHPATALCAAARADDLPILLLQHPAVPPSYATEDAEWMRMRVGVPFVPGEDLGALGRYLDAADALRAPDPARGSARVHVYTVPEFATYQSSQTAPDEADSGRRADPAGLREVCSDDVATGPIGPRGQVVAVCSAARVGLTADVLAAVSQDAGTRLTGISMAVLHGLAVLLLTVDAGTDTGPDTGSGATLDAVTAIRDRLRRHDIVSLLPPPPAPYQRSDSDGDRDGDRAPQPLVRMQVRVPERPQALRRMLSRLQDTLDDPAGLDVWFALFRVADGRSIQGRLVSRAPATSAPLAAMQLSEDGTGPDEPMDPVVDLDVLRTRAPAP